MVKITIEVDIWDMQDGKIKGFKYDNELFRPMSCQNLLPPGQCTPKPIIHLRGKRYVNVIDKWIRANNIQRFKVDDYVKDNPDRPYQRKRLDKYLSSMIADNTLLQIGNDEFKVNGNGGK